ncbi:MAG TPA: ATP-binding protein [Stellaceae bacterium]|nr:ATP-binding protein [Stellaceae bacterium]
MGVTISIVLLVIIALIAAVGVRWRLVRNAEGIAEERNRYLAELSAAEHEREVASQQIATSLARVAATAGTLDALPMPVWHRRKGDLSLIEVNEAYALAVDSTREATIAEQRELGIGVLGEDGRALALRARTINALQRESHHIVVGGQRRFLEITEAPLPNSDRLVGYARDFSDVESKESELHRHADSHAEVLQSLAVAVAIFGADTRLNFHNRAFATLWQLDAEWLDANPTIDELLERLREHRRLPEFVDFRAYKRNVEAMFTAPTTPAPELMHLPDDRTLRVSVSPHPMGGLIFVYDDVTDRLALERSFNTLTEVQRETLDQLKEGVAVYGADGRLKLSNPAFATMWKLSPDDLKGEPHINEIVDKTRALIDRGGDWPAQRRELVARFMSHAALDEKLERLDGSILRFTTVTLPDGNILCLYLDVTDTTKLADALTEKNAALEAADRLKSEFIANVSYELRTPLNVIVGFAELLVNQYFGKLNERQMEYGQGILTSATSLAALIGDILDLSTIEAGYFALDIETIDIRDMIAGLQTLAHERARARNVGFRLDVPADIGVLKGDQRRLKQAMFNLLSNAFKFTPSGGEVTLAARRLQDGVALSVSDTGPGVPPEDVARIFVKFERGTAPTRANGGIGLGLALVKSIVELHGGRIELDSVAGIGTAVICFLPNEPPAPPPAA